MSDVYFKASLQNTLNPEVGTFDNVDNKEGTFTLEDGEYYLTNNTETSYRVYYPTKDIYPVGFTTVEFDINYSSNGSSINSWCLLFNGNDESYHGFGLSDSTLQFVGDEFNYPILISPDTWLHVKCIFDYNLDQNFVHIYIDNVEVNNFTISNKYYIKYIDIIGNSVGYVANAKIKNITIYNSEKHYLDTVGLTSLWSKIKSLFATKSDLNNYYTKSGVDNLLSNIALSPSAIRAQWYAAYPDGPEAHNAMWGGRDITAAFNNGTVSANIANGTFYDIFPGDYIRKTVTIGSMEYTVNWVVADCDYWINKGDNSDTLAMKTHHVAIVPQQMIFEVQMNNTDTTEGGYMGSRMFKETIPACATGIVDAFGSEHILTFKDAISDSVDTSHISSGIPQWTGTPVWFGEWVSVQCNLMSEKMVYGAPVCSGGAMDNAMATRQMSAFRLSERLINYDRWGWWLRDIVSSSLFALVSNSGNAARANASRMYGVRPFALLR